MSGRYPIHKEWCHVSHDGPCLREDQPPPNARNQGHQAAVEEVLGGGGGPTDIHEAVIELRHAIDDLIYVKRRQGMTRDEAEQFVMDKIREMKARIDAERR